jgi:hypothetical protein
MPQTFRQKIGLKLHLLVCSKCSDYSKNLNWVSETLNDVADAPALDATYKIRPGFKSEIRVAIEKHIRQNSFSDDECTPGDSTY